MKGFFGMLGLAAVVVGVLVGAAVVASVLRLAERDSVNAIRAEGARLAKAIEFTGARPDGSIVLEAYEAHDAGSVTLSYDAERGGLFEVTTCDVDGTCTFYETYSVTECDGDLTYANARACEAFDESCAELRDEQAEAYEKGGDA